MNYNALVSIAREFARNMVRLTMTNNVRAKILNTENQIKDNENAVTEVNKDILRLNFKMSKIDDNDPDKTDKKKEIEEAIADNNKCLENLAKNKEAITNQMTKLNEEIEAIQKGDKKVSTETLQILSNDYLETLNREAMIKATNVPTSKE